TKYPTVASKFFREKGEDVEIIKIEGSVEIAPVLGLADAIIDIVETGSTLKENGLLIYEKMYPISARLIVNKASLKQNKTQIFQLIDQLEQVIKEERAE
ncbi:ATP phosphoribosyltransferase, partial [Escherichia coli]|nr:ATP phosphoribosyltransferase [Escherichia coli]